MSGPTTRALFTVGALALVALFALGGLFVAVTLFLPKGILGLIDQLMSKRKKSDRASAVPQPQEAD